MKKLIASLLDVVGIASLVMLFLYIASLFLYVFSSAEYPGDIARVPWQVRVPACFLGSLFVLRSLAKEREERMLRRPTKVGEEMHRMGQKQRKRLGITMT